MQSNTKTLKFVLLTASELFYFLYLLVISSSNQLGEHETEKRWKMTLNKIQDDMKVKGDIVDYSSHIKSLA